MEITEKHIKDLLTTYGAEPKHWPDSMRMPAQTWLNENVGARGVIDQDLATAQELDGILNLNSHTTSDLTFLQTRILKAAQDQPQEQPQYSRENAPANDHVVTAHYPNKQRPTSWGRSTLLSVKSLAATLLLTIGLGFGVGSSLGSISMANSEFSDAENILAASLLSDYGQSDYTDLTTPYLTPPYLTTPSISTNGDGL